MNRNEARYATVGHAAEVLADVARRGRHATRPSRRFANRVLTAAEKDAVFSGDFADARAYFDAMAAEGDARGHGSGPDDLRAVPTRAAARSHPPLHRVRRRRPQGRAPSAVLRHPHARSRRVKQHDVERRPQGRRDLAHAGLGQVADDGDAGALARARAQASRTRASSSSRTATISTSRSRTPSSPATLSRSARRAGLIFSSSIQNKAPLVTTIINKFDTALKNSKLADDDPNIFVLVDESHGRRRGATAATASSPPRCAASCPRPAISASPARRC